MRAWLSRAAIPPDLPSSNSASVRNGWNCSKRSRRRYREWQFFGIRPYQGGIGQLGAIQSVARSFGVELSSIDVRNPPEIERAVIAFARGTNGGLIVLSSATGVVHRELIITLAARHRLPAVYPYRRFVIDGGLISYGPDSAEALPLAAGYVDRILKGEKPADLPVQESTKQDLTINLKTAKALGIDVPPTLIARADEVIE